MKATRLYIVRDSDFTVRDRQPASYLLNYENYSKRYLRIFDEVIIVARLFDREDPNASPVTGPGVRFAALPGYRGPLGLLKSLPRIITTIRSTIDRDAAYLLRIPATIPILYSLVLKAMHIPFAVEVAADPYDGYSREALNDHKLAGLFRAMFVGFTKWQARNAFASAYVTREALQRRYPPRSRESSYSFTSIDLEPEAYVSGPRRPEDFNVHTPHLIMVGNMQKALKGHDTFLEAIQILKERGLWVRATIVGTGENHGRFEAMAKQLGIAEEVHFTGKLRNGPPVRAALDAADLFVLPSRQEGLPRALLEAMCRGLPAVASRVGGTPELLPEERLFDPGDAGQLADRVLEFATNATALSEASRRNLDVAQTYRSEIVTGRRDDFCRYIAGCV